MIKRIAAAMLLCLPTINSFADAGDLAVGLHGGTTGITVDVIYGLGENFNIRGGYNKLQYDVDIDTTDIQYDSEFDIESVSLLADWHVLGNGFRLSAGIYGYSENGLFGRPEYTRGQIYTFNDVDYSTDDLGDIKASVEFDDLAPYLGIGWGNSLAGSGFSFALDIGVAKVGKAQASLDYNCVAIALLCDRLALDVAAEIAELEAEAEDYELWPVLKLGITYKF